jgi:CRP/FNR family cyclic AMP-dependent transcriptional regulator
MENDTTKWTREILGEHPFVAGLSPRALDRLSVFAHRAVFRPGRRLFVEGGHADRFWLLGEGEVELSLTTAEGPTVIDRLGGGDVLGWSWLFPPYRWHFDATAVRLTQVVEFNGPGVRRLCDEDVEVGYELFHRFLDIVVRRMQATRTRLS